MTHILNPTGQRHVDEAMQPYEKLKEASEKVRDIMAAYYAVYRDDVKRHADLDDAYNSICDGNSAADDLLFDIDTKRDKLTEALLEEKCYRATSVDG